MAARDIPPVHPGEHLAEYLEELGLSQYALAKAIGVSPRRVNEIVQGKRSITADTALRLGRYFGSSPHFWMGLQMNYELEVANESKGAQIERAVKPREAA